MVKVDVLREAAASTCSVRLGVLTIHDSAFLTCICQPRTGYCAKHNAQHVQNVFVPAIRTEAWIRLCSLKQDETQ
jgi:hypothetical protein